MELFFVTVIGLCIGLIARYAFPQRGTYGLLLVPAIGAAAAAVVWVALVWAGLTFDGGWIWALSIAASIAASIATVLVLPRKRNEHDARLLAQLSGAKAA